MSNDLQYLDINSSDVRVIDPGRRRRVKANEFKPKGKWPLREIFLCTMAVASVVAWWFTSRPPRDEGLPQMAMGTWFTWEQKYLGQGFTLRQGGLTFHLGGDYTPVNLTINRVDRRQADGFEFYDLYQNLTDEWPAFSLMRAGDVLAIPSQREIRWQKGDIPVVENGVAPTEFFVQGWVPEEEDSVVVSTTDRLMEICMIEVTRVQRETPVSCIEWLGLEEMAKTMTDEQLRNVVTSAMEEPVGEPERQR